VLHCPVGFEEKERCCCIARSSYGNNWKRLERRNNNNKPFNMKSTLITALTLFVFLCAHAQGPVAAKQEMNKNSIRTHLKNSSVMSNGSETSLRVRAEKQRFLGRASFEMTDFAFLRWLL
jgi:hypothetical protein